MCKIFLVFQNNVTVTVKLKYGPHIVVNYLKQYALRLSQLKIIKFL